MPKPPPRPSDALRQHTRAVVLTAPGGDISAPLLDQIRDASVPFELIGHPLIAMAELARLEREVPRDGPPERTALVVCERDEFDDLNSLFDAVRMRLPRVSIWVFAGGLSVEVHRGRPPEPPRASATGIVEPVIDLPRPAPRAQPTLRIVDDVDVGPASSSGAADDEFESDPEPDDHPAVVAAAAGPVTPEELEMLLDLFEPPPEGEKHPGGGAR